MHSFDRNEVIGRAVNIEFILCGLITAYFFPNKKALNFDFMSKLFNDEGASANYKRSVFMKCYPDTTKAMDKNIRRVFSIRNTFAHIGSFFVERIGASHGHLSPDPKKGYVDLEALQAELLSLTPDIEAYLFGLLNAAGIEVIIPAQTDI